MSAFTKVMWQVCCCCMKPNAQTESLSRIVGKLWYVLNVLLLFISSKPSSLSGWSITNLPNLQPKHSSNNEHVYVCTEVCLCVYNFNCINYTNQACSLSKCRETTCAVLNSGHYLRTVTFFSSRTLMATTRTANSWDTWRLLMELICKHVNI